MRPRARQICVAVENSLLNNNNNKNAIVAPEPNYRDANDDRRRPTIPRKAANPDSLRRGRACSHQRGGYPRVGVRDLSRPAADRTGSRRGGCLSWCYANKHQLGCSHSTHSELANIPAGDFMRPLFSGPANAGHFFVSCRLLLCGRPYSNKVHSMQRLIIIPQTRDTRRERERKRQIKNRNRALQSLVFLHH